MAARLGTFLLLIASLLLAGCAAPAGPGASEHDMGDGPAPEPAASIQREETVTPRGWLELNVQMEAGAAFDFSFHATGALKWDIHSHEQGRVSTWREGSDDMAEGRFEAPSAGVYSLFFQNEGSEAVTLMYHVAGDFAEA